MNTFLNRYKSDFKATFNLALPIITAQVGVMLMGFADTVQVGRMAHGSVQALAAAADANGIFFNIAIIGYICLQVVAPLVSSAQSAEKPEECHQLLRASLAVSLIMSCICAILIVLFGLNIELLKQPIEIKSMTQEYLWIITASIFPSFLFSAFKSFTDGLSQTKVAMQITISALILNVVLNHVLINGWGQIPALGLNGAGYATLISRIYMAIAIIGYTYKSSLFKPYLTEVSDKIDSVKTLSIKIMKLGIPSGFQGFSEVAAFYGAVVMMGWISLPHKAAHQVAIGFVSMTFMAATGIGAAGGIRVGSGMGEKNRKAIINAGTSALLMGLIFMGTCSVIFLIFNDFLASYVKDDQVVELAAELIIWGGIFQLFDGVQAVSVGILRGIADVNVPTVITFIAYWVVGLPMCYFLGFVLDLKHIGIWIGLTSSLFVSASLLSWRFYAKSNKLWH
ncbi:MATE family efflux transporter [Flectobacillus sp. BAB-3569]|uniref:MATE family efflux transporter n=1 Tax=Flectobacillus sp. BAB-3569 TaxID=1509483 RepID=UPI0015963456|nr:MATE family efflux transporter [Flectobacillus sp. BAB-3569]